MTSRLLGQSACLGDSRLKVITLSVRITYPVSPDTAG